MVVCFVSYLDTERVRHSVEVEAESMYEAAALAIRAFTQHGYAPGIASQLDVEVRSPITHSLTVKKVHDWVTGGAKNPKEKILKDKLRELIDES